MPTKNLLVSWIRWESVRRKMNVWRGHMGASAKCNALNIVHLLFVVPENCPILVANGGWFHWLWILKELMTVMAGYQHFYIDSLLEEPSIWGLTPKQRILHLLFLCLHITDGWPWNVHKQMEKLLRRKSKALSVGESAGALSPPPADVSAFLFHSLSLSMLGWALLSLLGLPCNWICSCLPPITMVWWIILIRRKLYCIRAKSQM